MKKAVYSLCQISPLDIGVGPSKFARFEGMFAPQDPHSSYSIHNDIESLRSLDNQLAKERPDWSQKQIQTERHFRWKNGMGQAQIDSYKAEKRGDESMQSKEAFWDVKDGDLVHPNYGSFQKVIDNAVSEEERVSLIAWRDAAIHAESGSQIISVDYHNGLAIRYADAWVKTSDGRIKQQVRTNITNGTDLNRQEALTFLSRLTKSGKELVVDNKHNVGFVVIRPDTRNRVNLTKEVSAVDKTVITATKNTANEIKIRLQPVDRDLQQKDDGKLIPATGIKKDSIFDRVKSMFAKPDRVGDVLVRSVRREFVGLKLSDVRINLLPNRLGRERSKRTERKIDPRVRNRVEVFALMNEKKRRIEKSIA
ncbi:MAG: hypothetical protein NT149_03605, partial [Candidatus Gottesmanbacteria bacterium]|nr:hypothetical protein [Candidatus Gottesmanbacteria bacterium]